MGGPGSLYSHRGSAGGGASGSWVVFLFGGHSVSAMLTSQTMVAAQSGGAQSCHYETNASLPKMHIRRAAFAVHAV